MTPAGLIVNREKSIRLLADTPVAVGTTIIDFILDADTLLASLFVSSISGTLDVVITTKTDEGKTLDIITFPTITSVSTELLLQKASAALGNNTITATYSAACSFEIFGKGLGVGELTSRLVGQASGSVDVVSVPTGPATSIIPTALTDRSGIMITNNSTTGDLFIAFVAGDATTAKGTPVFPKSRWTGDLAAGVGLFGTASTGTIDVRIMELGA